MGWSDPKPSKIKDVQEWVQLFDLAVDPAETKNLASEHPEVVERMTKLAQQYVDKGRSTPGENQQNNGETHLYPDWIKKARSAK